MLKLNEYAFANQLIIFSFSVYGYKNISKKHCNNSYGQFSHIEHAKQACNNDGTCGSVYDKGCGSTKRFQLCPNTEDVFKDSLLNDCIHYKVITG